MQVEHLYNAYVGELVAVGPSMWCLAVGRGPLPTIGFPGLRRMSHKLGAAYARCGLNPQAAINGAVRIYIHALPFQRVQLV